MARSKEMMTQTQFVLLRVLARGQTIQRNSDGGAELIPAGKEFPYVPPPGRKAELVFVSTVDALERRGWIEAEDRLGVFTHYAITVDGRAALGSA